MHKIAILSQLIQAGDKDTIMDFLEQNPKYDYSRPNAQGRTALGIAAEQGTEWLVEALIAKGANVNSTEGTDGAGSFPLHLAAKRGSVEVVQLLLGAGADPNRVDVRGYNALHCAVSSTDCYRIARSLHSRVDLNQTTKEGVTPLWLAIERKFTGVVQELLELGADPDRGTKHGSPLLLMASTVFNRPHIPITILLLQHGANPHVTDERGNTPLAWANHHGYTDMVRRLSTDYMPVEKHAPHPLPSRIVPVVEIPAPEPLPSKREPVAQRAQAFSVHVIVFAIALGIGGGVFAAGYTLFGAASVAASVFVGVEAARLLRRKVAQKLYHNAVEAGWVDENTNHFNASHLPREFPMDAFLRGLEAEFSWPHYLRDAFAAPGTFIPFFKQSKIYQVAREMRRRDFEIEAREPYRSRPEW